MRLTSPNKKMNRNDRLVGRRKTSPLGKNPPGEDLEREIVAWMESGTDPGLAHIASFVIWTGEEVRFLLHDPEHCRDSGCGEWRAAHSGEALEKLMEDTTDLVTAEGDELLASVQEFREHFGFPDPPVAAVLVFSDQWNPRAGFKKRWMLMRTKAGTWEKENV